VHAVARKRGRERGAATTERHPFKAGAAERELGVRWGAAAHSERRRGGPSGVWRGVVAAGGKTQVRRCWIKQRWSWRGWGWPVARLGRGGVESSGAWVVLG
jgi:hypothetical protein